MSKPTTPAKSLEESPPQTYFPPKFRGSLSTAGGTGVLLDREGRCVVERKLEPDVAEVGPGVLQPPKVVLDREVACARVAEAIATLEQADAQLPGGLGAHLSSKQRNFLREVGAERGTAESQVADSRQEVEGRGEAGTPRQVVVGAPVRAAENLARRDELVRELDVLAAYGLDPGSIRELVTQQKHDEVCRRFAAAWPAHSLAELQPSFEVYQREIGAHSTAKKDKSEKRRIATLLNAVAKSVRAALKGENGAIGYLNVTGQNSGTFQLRSRAGGTETVRGVGQAIGALELRDEREILQKVIPLRG